MRAGFRCYTECRKDCRKMSSLNFEFDVKIEKMPLSSSAKLNHDFAKVPNVRKYLLLAHQINQLTEDSSDISLKKIADWLGVTDSRIRQIIALLLLCPKIQEEILLMDAEKLNSIKEYALRPIRREID